MWVNMKLTRLRLKREGKLVEGPEVGSRIRSARFPQYAPPFLPQILVEYLVRMS